MNVVVGDYEYCENDLIGRGSFAKVYKGRSLKDTNLLVAIKVIELAPNTPSAKHLLREVELVKCLDHKNIVKLYDVQQKQTNKLTISLYIIMEYCERGDLANIEKPLDEEKF